jgi:hypothetical protein
VIPPAGTFLASVRNGVIQLPPPLKRFCEAEGWSLFRFIVMGPDHLRMQPILAEKSTADFSADDLCASLGADGRLWVPGPLRETVSLGEQSVMLRVEDGAIGMYLRKVFKTLGFRP